MFGKHEILTRINGLDQRLQAIEATLQVLSKPQMAEPEQLERLREKNRQVDALSQQGMNLVKLLDEARKEIEQLKRGQGS